MLNSFIVYALAAGVCVAVVGGVLGCFVVWRKMAYFGDSLAHSSLLGAVLGAAYGVNPNIGILAVCFAFAAGLMWLQQRRLLATDTLLGILAHSALAAGVIAASFSPVQNFDLHSYLFGDILTVGATELTHIAIAAAVALVLLFFNWASLVLTAINEDLARAEGVNTFRMRLLLIFLMTLVVALSIRVVGILLITSLLIMPAAAARQLTKTPEAMAIVAACGGVIAVTAGLFASLQWDSPAGPSIVACAALLFATTLIIASAASNRLRRCKGLS